DLGRNDLGRVSRPGSVEVSRFMGVERYSHVMHLVSEVTGRLRAGRDAFDGLLACFPAGTVSGAPKVRAMEIIEELETTRRGPYAGAVGYVDYSGNLDSCITIRTTVMTRGVAHVQAGAGIVADSVPQREYRECVSKARALIDATEHAEARARASSSTTTTRSPTTSSSIFRSWGRRSRCIGTIGSRWRGSPPGGPTPSSSPRDPGRRTRPASPSRRCGR